MPPGSPTIELSDEVRAKLNALTVPQAAFVLHMLAGYNQSEAYAASYPENSGENLSSLASRLMRLPQLAEALNMARNELDRQFCLGYYEKRRMLADAARLNKMEAYTDEDFDWSTYGNLVHKIKTTTTERGDTITTTRELEFISLRDCLALDNAMANHNGGPPDGDEDVKLMDTIAEKLKPTLGLPGEASSQAEQSPRE